MHPMDNTPCTAEQIASIRAAAGINAYYLTWLVRKLESAEGAAYTAQAAEVIRWMLEDAR